MIGYGLLRLLLREAKVTSDTISLVDEVAGRGNDDGPPDR